ncbi:MAG: tetratricopeptide repeat protein [Chroococcales cyanobacterium]
MLIAQRYQIIKELGRGGFGITYLVQDTKLPGYPQRVLKQLQIPPNATPQVQQKVQDWFYGQQIAKSLDSYTLKIVPTDYKAWQNLAGRWYGLGQQWEKLNQWQEAIIAYDKALAIRPDHSGAIEGKNRVINRSVF